MLGAILSTGTPCLFKVSGQFNQSSGQKLLAFILPRQKFFLSHLHNMLQKGNCGNFPSDTCVLLGLRALLRFMTGIYVCMNRGDVDVRATQV